MKVTNINGTSDSTCKCGTWLKHWEKFSGQTTNFCAVTSCIRTDLVGAHVQKANSSDNNWYICPLCISHNQSIDDLEIADWIELAPANKKETCDK